MRNSHTPRKTLIDLLTLKSIQPRNHLQNARHWWIALARSPTLRAPASPTSLRSPALQALAHDRRPSTSSQIAVRRMSRARHRSVAFVLVVADRSMHSARLHPHPTDRLAQPMCPSRIMTRNQKETLRSQAIEKVHLFYLSIPSRTYPSARHALQHNPQHILQHTATSATPRSEHSNVVQVQSMADLNIQPRIRTAATMPPPAAHASLQHHPPLQHHQHQMINTQQHKEDLLVPGKPPVMYLSLQPLKDCLSLPFETLQQDIDLLLSASTRSRRRRRFPSFLVNPPCVPLNLHRTSAHPHPSRKSPPSQAFAPLKHL